MGNGNTKKKIVTTSQQLNSNFCVISNELNSAPNNLHALSQNNIVIRNITEIIIKKRFIKEKILPKIIKNNSSSVFCITHLSAFHKNLFATGHEDGLIVLWDINTFNNYKVLAGHIENFKIRGLIHIPHINIHELISSSEDKTIKLWNITTTSCIRTILTTSNILTIELMIKENFIISAHAFDYQLYIWDFTKDEPNDQLVYNLPGHLNNIWTILFIKEKNYLLSGSEDCTIILWDLNLKTFVRIYDEHIGLISSLLYTGEDKFVSCSLDKKIKFWIFDSSISIYTIELKTSIYSIKNLISITDKSILIASTEESLFIIDYEKFKIVKSIKTEYYMAPIFVIDNNSRFSFISCDNSGESLQIWDLV